MSRGPRLVKMSGAGNDFVVITGEDRERITGDWTAWVRAVCRRRLAVGADGVLVVEKTGPDRVRVRFHNPDGSAAFCGNGSRCAARFARREGLAGDSMVLDTAAGDVPARVGFSTVRLELPPPVDRGVLSFDLDGTVQRGRSIRAGVPHVIFEVESVDAGPLERWGPVVRRDPRFGEEGTNVDLVSRRPDGTVALRTWERGVEGETLACGSGAVAAGFAAWTDGVSGPIRIVPASGIPLTVEPSGERVRPGTIVLEGDARFVFDGTLDEEAISSDR